MDNLIDIKVDSTLLLADVLFFSVTWLTHDVSEETPDIQLEGYILRLNSVGRGKGIATYYKKDAFGARQLQISHIKKELMQMTVLSSPDLCLINVYKSKGDRQLQRYLTSAIESEGRDKCILIIGDLNFCFSENPENELSCTLADLGFIQTVKESTHIEGGHIDHVYFRESYGFNVDTRLYSPYYTCHDYDCILVSRFQGQSDSCKYKGK